MNIEEFPEDSDTSDEDYVPSGKQEDVPSEIDSDDEVEPLTDSDSEKVGNKRKKKPSKVKKKQKKNFQDAGNSSNGKEEEDKQPDNKTKNVDDIWADFMKDTGFMPKNSKNATGSSKLQVASKTSTSIESPSQKTLSQKSTEKVKITQIFEFAGEEVKVEKEVSANSAEARLLNETPNEVSKPSRGRKGGGLSGIGSVLSQLGKKPKISTLEKSKLDWDKFKREENIEEELQTYNKGKDGFLDRQDFLQRADLRRFEIEKDLRTIERNKRFNSTL